MKEGVKRIMDKEAINKRLKELANTSKRSKAARLRDVLESVETALAAGVSRASILEELNKNGLDMSLLTFETTMKRLRKKSREKTATTLAKSANPLHGQITKPMEVKETQQEDEPELSGEGSHNPADLDAIMGSLPDLSALAKLRKKRK